MNLESYEIPFSPSMDTYLKVRILRCIFSQFEWYKPEFNNVNHKLNSVEKENIKILKQAEDNGNLSSLANIRDWQIV